MENNHYNVLYEKNPKDNIKETKLNEVYWNKIKEKTMKSEPDLEIDINYVNDKRTYKCKDIYNYIKSKDDTGSGIYPQFIYDIKEKNKRKNKKKISSIQLKDFI